MSDRDVANKSLTPVIFFLFLFFLELRWEFLPSVACCRPWPWNTTTKKWNLSELKISHLPLPRCVIMWGFFPAHQKEKTLQMTWSKKWLTSFKLELTQQPANFDYVFFAAVVEWSHKWGSVLVMHRPTVSQSVHILLISPLTRRNKCRKKKICFFSDWMTKPAKNNL